MSKCMYIIYIYTRYIHILEVVFYSIISLHLNDIIILGFGEGVIRLATEVEHTILRFFYHMCQPSSTTFITLFKLFYYFNDIF